MDEILADALALRERLERQAHVFAQVQRAEQRDPSLRSISKDDYDDMDGMRGSLRSSANEIYEPQDQAGAGYDDERPSAPSKFDFGIDGLELDSRVSDFHLPINPSLG